MADHGSWGDVHATIDGHVAVVEVRRPPHNYFDVAMVGSLVAAFGDLDDTPDCRAIVLCSAGKNFCAGARLADDTPSVIDAGVRRLYAEATRLFDTATPIVAAVQGAAVGGGLGLALVADFRVASPASRFTANFARLGFHQGFGISVTLPRVVGHQHALDLLYTGRRIGGEEAAAMGLVDRLVEPGEERATAVAFASEIAESAPLAVRSIRETMRGDLAGLVALATEREADQQERLRGTDDFAEGVAAMEERRPPRFRGR